MALALLKHIDSHKGKHQFQINIGSNRYYRYAIGNNEHVRQQGIKLLANPSFISNLIGPIPEHSLGRVNLEVDKSKFDRDIRFIQIQSFRDRQLNGPAISDIVEIPRFESLANMNELYSLPLGDFAMKKARPMLVKPFDYQEIKYSNAMFLNTLTSLLPQVLPQLVPLASGLIGNLLGQNHRTTRTTQAVLNDLGNEQNTENLANLLQQISRLVQGSTHTQTSTTQSLARKLESPMVEAQAIPIAALAGALPALMPLLQQVLNPQTLQTVIDAPNRHTQTIINGIKDFAKIGLDIQKQQDQHLENLNPGVDDPALDSLLANLSLSLAKSPEPNYKRVSSVRLQFSTAPALTAHGQSKLLYQAGRDLAFPLIVNTPRAIKQGKIIICVKERETLNTVLRKKVMVNSVENGALTTVPTITQAELSHLKPNDSYYINIHLIWKNNKGEKRGTSIQQLITLSELFIFDRVEESNQLLELVNFNQFREYWHKVWEGRFSEDFKRYELRAKYYYILKPDNMENVRLETKLKLKEQETKRIGQLKTGMELSPVALNRLLSQIAPTAPPLSQEELAALSNPDFVQRFNTAAMYHAKFRGRAHERAQFWVYPVIKLQQVVLKRIGSVDANGQVTSLTEHMVKVPMPVQVHFVGVKS